jgi:hypothetical protein
LTNL